MLIFIIVWVVLLVLSVLLIVCATNKNIKPEDKESYFTAGKIIVSIAFLALLAGWVIGA
jgi:cytochrome bd-type quinol oxidase subunit 1